MYISIEQSAATPSLQSPPAAAVAPVPAPFADAVLRRAEPAAEPPEVLEELLIEEVSIDGMCGVY